MRLGQYVSFLYNQGGALVKWFRQRLCICRGASGPVHWAGSVCTLLAEMPEQLSPIIGACLILQSPVRRTLSAILQA